ncbi:MAG: hypothetical protein J6J04_04365 [Oscillospiraceae bacterium]|nr:hypothetical protein [Oscillospiraceae bacterium]
MMKLPGALLLITGFFLSCRNWILQRREELCRLEELTIALEHMSAMIRMKKEPILQAAHYQKNRTHCGALFQQLTNMMHSDHTLQYAWNQTFSAVQPVEAANILNSVELSGDESRITGGLNLAANQLRELAACRRAQQKQNERLCLTLGSCIAGVIVIMLI